jgi:hypothetical protein
MLKDMDRSFKEKRLEAKSKTCLFSPDRTTFILINCCVRVRPNQNTMVTSVLLIT